jgi:hypothetical protein
MVYPPAFYDEPVVKDTNIDQSILDELLKVEKIKRYQGILDKTSDEINNQQFDEIGSIKDFGEEDDDKDPEIDDIDIDELSDLSEYEDMIDWEELPDADDLTEHEKQFYNGTKDLDIN